MSGLNRKQRRQNEKRAQKAKGDYRYLPEGFGKQMDLLAGLGGFASHVSIAQTGLPSPQNAVFASMVFAKCCAHARSIGAISMQSSMFDHHAIMTISRMIVEASTMLAYLLDPVPPEEWQLRHTLLRLHDTVNRIKLLRGFGAPRDDLSAGRAELQADLEAHPTFQSLIEERRKRLLTGEEMFVTGMRSAAIKIMGWDEHQFTGIYGYLSAHTHSAPMSFMRMAEHQIDYFFPSETQTEILAISMEVAIACLRRSMLRVIDQRPEQVSIYHPELLAENREADATCPFFTAVTKS